MIRNLWLILLLGILALSSGWMAEHPGQVTLQWFGYEVQTSAAFLAIALVASALVLWLGFRVLALLLLMPGNLGKARGAAAQQRGLAALTDAFVALGDQDTQAAEKHLKLAERLLPDPTLPHLMGLQLARQQGNDAALREQFRRLQDSPQTRPLALRGLVEEARRDRRLEDALSQAQLKELLVLRPRHKPTLILAVDVYSGQRRWQEALQWIVQGQKKWVFSRQEARHLAALVYTEQAQAMLAENNGHSAAEMLRAALKREISHAPAAILLAQYLIDTQQLTEAASVLRKAWAANPVLEMVQLYGQCLTENAAEKKLKKRIAFAKSAPATALWEVQMAQARAYLDAGEYAATREHLKAATGIRGTVLTCQWMAELEQKEHQDSAKVAYWLGQAATAIPDALWRCGNCGHQPSFWQAHCSECNHFDRVQWQAPQPAGFVPLS